jgi:hypothetical protein
MPHPAGGTISAIVATYNRGKVIEECLNSIFAQTRPPHQVVVVDDGSDDDTGPVVAGFGGRVTYLKKENGGKASALNLGMPLLTGDYIWIFDDDDLALPDCLARLAEVLDREPELGFVYSNHWLGDTDADDRIVTTRLHRRNPIPPSRAALAVMKSYSFAMQGILVRRQCYEAAGPFDVEMLRSADYEMMIRLACRYRFAAIEEPTFILRRHDGARGPAALRHAGDDSQRSRIHAEYDGKIGLIMRRDLPLTQYLTGAPGQGPLSNGEKRTALLTRMSIMAGKGLVAEMIRDLEEACAVPVGLPLTRHECALCEEAMHFPYFWPGLADRSEEFMRGLRRCSATRVGRQAIRQFAQGMFSHAKSYRAPLSERARRLLYVGRFSVVSIGRP